MSACEPLIYTVIPIHNHYRETRRAVTSLLASSYTNNTICIVDNGSTDGSQDLLLAEFPTLHYIRLDENKGFAAAINIGIQSARKWNANFVFLCNNDTVVDADMLHLLVAQTDDGVGALSPVIYYLDYPEKRWFAGHRCDPLLLELRPHPFERQGMPLPSHPFQTEYLFGCGLLINMRAIEKIGGFDERYFFYYEDMDFSLRLAQANFSLWIVPAARMWHEVSLTAGPASAFGTFHKARSSVVFFTTHLQSPVHGTVLRWLRFLAIPGFRLLSSLRKSLSFLIKGRYDLLRSHWRGLAAGWRSSWQAPQIIDRES